MQNRNRLLEILGKFRLRAGEAQRNVADRFLSLARDEARATHRDCFPAHLTASALITEPSKQRVLLCHHRKLGKWLQLGGHADGDWDLAAAALREAQEESGLTELTWENPATPPEPVDLDIHLIPARREEPEHWHYDVRYLFVARRPETIQVSSESLALKWADEREAFQLGTEPALLRLFEKVWRTSAHVALVGLLSLLWGCSKESPTDAGFGSAGVLSIDVTAGKDDDLMAVALQSDGRILLAGRTKAATDDFAVVRVLTDGTLDESFGSKGIVTVDFSAGADTARAIGLLPGGKVLVVGDTTDTAGVIRMAATRLNTNGSLDSTFGTAGKTSLTNGKRAQAASLAVAADGRAYLAGSTTGTNGTLDIAVAALTASGLADTSFGRGGFTSLSAGPEDDEATSIALTTDGRILVAGSTSRSARRDFLILAFRATGTLDTSFGANGKQITNVSQGTASQESTYTDDSTSGLVLSTGKSLLTVGASNDGTTKKAVVTRHRPGGTLDPSFATGGIATLSADGQSLEGSSLLDLPDGNILVGLRVTERDAVGISLARLTPAGVLDTTFTEDGFLALGLTTPADSLALLQRQTDGKFLIAATVLGATRDFAIARFAP